MSKSLRKRVEELVPSKGELIIAYVMALGFPALAIFTTDSSDSFSDGTTVLWMIGFGWMGRAIDKTRFRHNLLKALQKSKVDEELVALSTPQAESKEVEKLRFSLL